jgi:uncharacterized protein YuzE
MKDPKLFYFDREDILHLVLAEGEEANSVELSPTITAELNAPGEVIGMEILHASTFARDTLLALAQLPEDREAALRACAEKPM